MKCIIEITFFIESDSVDVELDIVELFKIINLLLINVKGTSKPIIKCRILKKMT